MKLSHNKFLDCNAEEIEKFFDSIVTGDEIWVQYMASETKEESRLWIHLGSLMPQKLNQTLFVGKVMVTVFWIGREYFCASSCLPGQQ